MGMAWTKVGITFMSFKCIRCYFLFAFEEGQSQNWNFGGGGEVGGS